MDEIERYKKIIESNPVNVNKYLQELGAIYETQQKYYDAVACYVKILKTEKTNISTIGVITNQIGVCYSNIEQFKLAIHYFSKVLKIKEIPQVYSSIGMCSVNLKDYKAAEINLLRSYELDNTNIQTNNLLGQLYYYTKKYDKSIKYYRNTIKKGDDPNKLYTLSFNYLSKKDFKTGFELYENRLAYNNINKQTNVNERLDVPLAYWNGTTKCSKLLLLAEQGLGDNIQYYRFIIELSEKYPTMKITYFCKKELAHIFITYNNNIEIIHNLFVSNNTFDYDYKLYIMSLPKILNLTSIVPNKINYIKTHEDKLTFWKDKTSSLKKYKVGFVYNGLVLSYVEKNIPLKEFEILCDLDIELICLHRKGELEPDLNNVSFKDRITHYDIDIETPFEDTIHLLQNLDLLITIDTFIVHLAGVLNVKTWLLLGISDWRWSDDEYTTYWYDSVELIRAKEGSDLKDVLQIVKDKLMLQISPIDP